MKLTPSLPVIVLAVASASSFAGPSCTQEPKDKWLSETQMKKIIDDAGYQVDKFKLTSGNCYEIYGKDKTGKRAEVYFHPVDGHVVKSE